jgi:hypothetical protein
VGVVCFECFVVVVVALVKANWREIEREREREREKKEGLCGCKIVGELAF